jgi:WD40 repeat protein
MALLPDGKGVLTAGYDGTVRLWDTATGKELRRIVASNTHVRSMALSRDGKRLAVGGPPGVIYEVATGKELVRTQHYLSYGLIAFLDDDRLACGRGGQIALVDKTGQESPQFVKVEPIVTAVAGSPDGKLLASGNHRGNAQVLSGRTGKRGAFLKGSDGPVSALAFSPEGKTLAVAGTSGPVRLWDVATGKLLRSLSGGVGFRSLVFSPDGKFLATGDRVGTVRILHVETGRAVRSCPGHAGIIGGLAFTPGGETLYTADSGAVRVWETGLGQFKGDPVTWRPAPAQERNPQPGHAGAMVSVGFTPDGRTFLTTGLDHRLLRWDTATGRFLGEGKDFAGRPNLFSAFLLPGGRAVLAVELDGTLALCDPVTGKELRRGRFPKESPDVLAVSPAGRLLAVASAFDHHIHLFDASTLRPLRRWAAHHDGITGLAFGPDGKSLASLSADRTLRVWDVATSEEQMQVGDGPVEPGQVAFSSDGRTLASGGTNNKVCLWDAVTGKKRGELTVPTIQAHSLAFSPDGRYLAAAYRDGVTLWEAFSGQEVVRFHCDQHHGGRLLFSPDGRRLATGNDPGVLLWDVTGRRAARKQGHSDLSEAEQEALWQDLAAHEAARADRALGELAASPRLAVLLLARRLRPVARAEERLIRQWVEWLAHADRPTREAAEVELEALGEAAKPVMSRIRETTPSGELFGRAEQWLQDRAGFVKTPHVLRDLRAVAVLERVTARPGDDEKESAQQAQRLLERLASGEPGAPLTRAARSALGRAQRPDPAKEPAVDVAENNPLADPLAPPAKLLRQLGESLIAPEATVACVAFRPGSTTLALATTDNKVRLWDALNLKELRRWFAPVVARTPLAFSPDGKVLFAGGPDGLIRRWDLDTGRGLSRWRGHEGRIDALTVSRDGKQVASGGVREVVVWEVATGKPSWRVSVPEGTTALAIAPDGKTLAACCRATVRTWELPEGKQTRSLRGIPGSRSLAFTPDGKRLLVRGPLRDAVLWDLARNTEEPVDPNFRAPVYALALSADGKWAATGLGTGSFCLVKLGYDPEVRELVRRGPVSFRMHPSRPNVPLIVGTTTLLTTASFSSDGKYLVAAGTDRRVRVFDLTTFAEVAPKDGPPAPVVAVAFTADGRSLVAAHRDHQVRTWDLDTGKVVQARAFQAFPHRSMILSANGEFLAVYDFRQGKVILRHLTGEGKEERILDLIAGVGPDDYRAPLLVALSADAKLLATAESAGRVRLWATTTGKLQRTIEGGEPGVTPYGMTFSPDGRTLALTDTSHAVAVYDLVGGRRLPPFQGRKGYSGPPAFSPDGRTVYNGYGKEGFCQWEVASGKFCGPLVEIPGHGGNCLALSPDGRTLVTASADFALHFWDARTGRPLGLVRRHVAPVQALAFSPDGTRLVSAGDDGLVLVWEVAPRREFLVPEPRAEELPALWDELHNPSALRARRGMFALERKGEQTVALFEQHLRPAGGVEGKRLAGLIADLDNDAYAVRERASRELERLGEQARPALRATLERRVSLEARRRIEKLLALPAKPVRPRDRVPELRALEILEQLGTPRARLLVDSLCGGDPGDQLTREAQATRHRLAKKSPRVP